MHQVSRHEEMLYEIDTKMFIMNKTIKDVMRGFCFLQYEFDILSYFKPESLYYIHHFMPSRGMLTHCMNI